MSDKNMNQKYIKQNKIQQKKTSKANTISNEIYKKNNKKKNYPLLFLNINHKNIINNGICFYLTNSFI